jgi:hypothetical protein
MQVQRHAIANTAHLALIGGHGCQHLVVVFVAIVLKMWSALCLLLCEQRKLVVDGAP